MPSSLRAAKSELLPVVAFLVWAFLLLATMRGAWGSGRSAGPLLWEDARRIPSETLRREALGADLLQAVGSSHRVAIRLPHEAATLSTGAGAAAPSRRP